MIVAEGPNYHRLITQNDHAELAGQFAAHWGNGEFSKPNPYPSMVLLAERHDNGWWEWDTLPDIDEAGRPVTFYMTPRDRWTRLMGGGIDATTALDPYAGLLASMHATGLAQQRYATEPKMPERLDPDSRRFVAEREARQKELRAGLERSGPLAPYVSDPHLWFNWKLLQVWDRLSLYFCCNVTLKDAVIDPLPVAYGREDVRMAIAQVDDAAVALSPYPFGQSPLRVTVRGRLLPKRRYGSTEEFRGEYLVAERQLFAFTLQRG